MQTTVLSVWRIFKCRYVLITGCDHDILKIQSVTQIHGLNVVRKQVVWHIGTSMGIVHGIRYIHVCTKFCQVLLQWSNVRHPGVQSGNPLLHILPGILRHQELFWKLMVKGWVYEVLFMDWYLEKELHLLRYQHHQKNYMLAICLPV